MIMLSSEKARLTTAEIWLGNAQHLLKINPNFKCEKRKR